MKVKLFDYQEEFINAKEKLVIGNFARGLGKTFSLVNKIIKEKPKRVLWISPSYRICANNFHINIRNIENISYDVIKGYANIEYNYNLKNKTFIKFIGINESVKGEKADLVIIEDCIFENDKIIKDLYSICNCKQIIYTLTENNSDKHLNKMYYNARIIEVDGFTAINKNVFNLNKSKLFDMDDESYFNEFAILDDKNSDKFATILDFFKEYKSKTNWFKEKIKELQNEYDSTPRCKNTLMTRKDIINLMETISALPEKFSKLNS